MRVSSVLGVWGLQALYRPCVTVSTATGGATDRLCTVMGPEVAHGPCCARGDPRSLRGGAHATLATLSFPLSKVGIAVWVALSPFQAVKALNPLFRARGRGIQGPHLLRQRMWDLEKHDPSGGC